MKYVVKMRMRAIYEGSLEVEADSMMEAFDKAQDTAKNGKVAANFVGNDALRITSLSEAPETL
jgi:hypothetical protein